MGVVLHSTDYQELYGFDVLFEALIVCLFFPTVLVFSLCSINRN